MRQLEHHEIDNDRRRYPITLLCADWADPRNVGAAFRLADATGLRELILAGSTPRPPHRHIDKTARTTVRSVPHRYVTDAAAYLREARRAGALVLALEVTDVSQSLFDYRLSVDERELILVAGAERGGVGARVLAECDAAVYLPMHGQNSSMNVAVALGAAVYLLLVQLQ